ncbi:hypothetical protein PLESTF_000055300 [Pleodorina starrii]|nr:hypothetical protein PLESTM_001583500 [Pleodorina starrii]GLC63615.1 hypothetical protein PLESTF_000055300 [Pleodorina starrii]
MPALVLLGRQLLIASDDVPLFALPAALFHSAWTVVLIVTLILYQQHPVCRDEGDYLPFLAGGAGAFSISSALEWSLFSVGTTGTPLETHARWAVPLLLYLHTAASVAELGFAAYGAHLLHVDTRLCTAWSPRPLAVALVVMTWVVIALNGLLTALALNPWHGLGLVEAWEARLLWLARLVCCRGSRLLTQARVPDREPALRRIAQLTSHLLQHVDLTLSDVAAAMILVAAAQRERRRRALRDAMAAAHAALVTKGSPTMSNAVVAAAAVPGMPGSGPRSGPLPAGAPASSSCGPGRSSGASGGGGGGLGSGSERPRDSPAATQGFGLPGASQGEGEAAAAAAAAAEGSVTMAAAAAAAPGGLSPFLAVQQPQAAPHLQQQAQQQQQQQQQLRVFGGGVAGGGAAAAIGAGADGPAASAAGGGGGGGGGWPPPMGPGGAPGLVVTSPCPVFINPLLSPTTSHTNTAPAGSGVGVVLGTQGLLATGGPAVAEIAAAAPPAPAADPAGGGLLPSPSRAITLMHPIVHITPAGMEEHLDELVGELVGELAAEAAEEEGEEEAEEGEEDADGELGMGTAVHGGGGGGGLLPGGADAAAAAAAQLGSVDLDAVLDLDLDSRRETQAGGEGPGGGDVRMRLMGSSAGGAQQAAVAAVTAAAAAAAVVGTAAAAPSTGALTRQASSRAAAALRKRIGEAALAAAFAAEREMVDRETLQEAAVYGRYAAAIYGSCPPDGPGASAAWHLGGDGDGSSPDEVAAWRRRHGSSAPDPLLASILSSASRCTEHVVHVNTHNSTEGYLPYMVCLDKPTRSVVIAIRGTFSAEDIVTDCLCEPFDIRHHMSGSDFREPGAPETAGTAGTTGTAGTAAATGAATGAGTTGGAALNGPSSGGAAVSDPLAAAAAAVASVAAASVGGGPTPSGEASAPWSAVAGGGGGGGGVGGIVSLGDEPVLVHAGIWAAADVIWEDLREVQLLNILLPPPRTGSETTTTNPHIPSHGESVAPTAALAAAAAPAGPTARRGSGGGDWAGSPDGSRREHPPQPAAQVPPRPAPPPRHQLQPQNPWQEGRSPPDMPRPSAPQRQPLRRRPASLDLGRPAAAAAASAASAHPGPLLAAPPLAAYGTASGAADPFLAHHHLGSAAAAAAPLDVGRRNSGLVGPHSHMPRLISAERQATMPHGSGLSALLQRHRLQQRLPPPPPPPAAALLPSLVLSYHPPGRAASSMLPLTGAGGGGAAAGRSRRRREFLPSALRRRSLTADGDPDGGGRGRSGRKGRSVGGRSSGDDDNDPRAPLLSPPLASAASAAAGAGAGAGTGGCYSPAGAGATMLLPARAAAIGAANSPPEPRVRHSFDLGFGLCRTSPGAGAGARAGLERGFSPSRLAAAGDGAGSAGGRPSGSPPPPLPPPPAAAAAAPPQQLVRGTAATSAASGLQGPFRSTRASRASFGRPSRDECLQAGESPDRGAAAAAAPPPSLFGRLQRAASGLVRAVASALPRRGAALPPLPPASAPPPPQPRPPPPQQETNAGQEHKQDRHHPAQRRLAWLRQYGGRFASASEGGAHLPYMSLPRTEAEAERQAGGGGGAAAAASTAVGGGVVVGGSVSAFDPRGRRWRSLGGAGGDSGGGGGGGIVSGGGGGGRGFVDGGVVDGWSIGVPYSLRAPVDLEAPAAAPTDSSEMEEEGTASERQHQPSTAGGGGGAGGGGSGDGTSASRGAPSPPPPPPPLRLPEVDCSGWRLVVTGHSLGAGAAALLALRLRSALPHVEVRCWAFAPPGSLTSPALSRALRPFTVSVVTGKDLIPRLSLNTMERYRDEMITALARCSCSKARVLIGSFSRRNRLRRAAHLLLPYNQIPDQARGLLRDYHEAVERVGRLPELHPPGRILYLQPSARAADGARRGAAGARSRPRPRPSSAASSASSAASCSSAPAYRPVWVSARELLSEGILASTRMLVDHSLTLCTLPALDEILRA